VPIRSKPGIHCSRSTRSWIARLIVPLALLAAPAQAQAQLTVARTSTPIFYTDVGNTPSLQCAYASYRITNTSGVTQPDVWIGIGSFTGGVVRLAPGEDGLIHFGSMAPGEVRNAYFYLQAPSITAVAQAHTVSIYTSKPPVAAAVTQVFSFSQVVSTIAASANKVTTVVTGPKPPGLGGVVTITVSGQTGTIGAAGILALSPATDTAWRPDALEMLGCTVTLSGSPNAGVHTDSLYYVLPSASATDYVIEYRFRAVGTTAAPVAVTPIGYISSGTQIKHTSTGNFLNGTLEPIEPPSNFVTVTKQVTPASRAAMVATSQAAVAKWACTWRMPRRRHSSHTSTASPT